MSESFTDQLAIVRSLATEERYTMSPREKVALRAVLARLDAESAENKCLKAAWLAVADLIDSSNGVVGLHLNGDIATWGELSTGGRFEDWLVAFDDASKLIKRDAQGGVIEDA